MYVPVAHGREAVRRGVARVLVVADTRERLLELVHHGGGHLPARQSVRRQRCRDLVAERAGTGAGAGKVRALEPSHDAGWLELEQSRVTAMRNLVESDGGWRSEPIPEIADALNRLRVLGAVLQVPELAAIGKLLVSSRLTKAALSNADAPAISTALLRPFRDALLVDASAEEAIAKVIAEDGSIRDGASPLLRRVLLIAVSIAFATLPSRPLTYASWTLPARCA